MIEINCFYPMLFLLLAFLIFAFKELVYKHLRNIKEEFCKNKDCEIIEKLLSRYPLVSSEFLCKTKREQLAENNQEIHEINIKLDEQEEIIKKLTKLIEEISDRG